MQLNQAGIDLIKHFEGCRLHAYPDPATGGAPFTIGYGHTGPEVLPFGEWSQAQAEMSLSRDLGKVEQQLLKCIATDINDNQFSACVSLVFNIGIGNFTNSTLLKKIDANDLTGAADEFLRWNHAAGKVMAGLTLRRTAERELFLKGV